MKVTIHPGTVRDITFVAVNMREQDREEVFATALLRDATEAGYFSYHGSGPEWCWTAWLGDEVAGAFGISYGSPLQPHIRSAWAFGTDKFKRVVPSITRFIKHNWPYRLIDAGVTRVEVRSLATHDIAHSWLASIGARRECVMTSYGLDGQDFELWAFLKKDFI